MKFLITGASGQLGSELQRQLAEGGNALGAIPVQLHQTTVLATDSPELDITDRKAVLEYMNQHRPDVVINCAAFTNVDGCENQREAAFAVNALGPANLAFGANQVGAKMIHVSTDYVFSGEGNQPLDEAEPIAPVSAYGKTKALGEQYVMQQCPHSFVVRTAWLYGYQGKNFVKTIVNAAKKFGKLEVVSDQLGNPTNAEDLAHHLLQLAVSDQYGIYHCTGEGICSWYDFAARIVELAGVDATVSPCTSEEYAQKHPEAARRPAWSALENRMLALTVGNGMRHWEQALEHFFEHWDGQ